MDAETQHCLDEFNYILKYRDPQQAITVLDMLIQRLRDKGIAYTPSPITSYINTIPPQDQPHYPGNIDLETRIENIIRWNAMAMVVKANKHHDGLGGHISTFASSAVLYEVGYMHFFKGNNGKHEADQVFFQGHASPGNYARAFLEGRLTDSHLTHFRQELSSKDGLSSYPHPYLMPDFWQFPTVSMGLGPVMAIYQARFNRYLKARGFITHDPHVWCFIGDGESDEPETLGALSIAAREGLNNLTFVVNCNLQRLDGPVRGNGKIIQDLEGVFRGAGWNVIKVIWGSNWDPLLLSSQKEDLINRMNETVDGEFQKYIVEPGSYMRTHFFGKNSDLLAMVDSLSDTQLLDLQRGGHDRLKVYAAYQKALSHTGGPSVILAKTIKGYGMGGAGEGQNISHQQKKLTEKELRDFRARFDIPINDDEVASVPFYKPNPESPEMVYLQEKRQQLGGYLPERKMDFPSLNIPELSYFEEFLKASNDGQTLSTTMAFVRILNKLLRHPDLAKHIVPIVPDEGRTFGMEALFRQIGIYSPKGQLYTPSDSHSLLYYHEASDGQLLEEGINEVGAMSSFLAAGTAHATHGVPMIPFYIYYSMFGFQRIGDLMWLGGDIQTKGFLLGGTAGRTTLNGEGLQHQDGHSLLLASTIPNLMTYDIAFRYEVAVVIQDGLKRMYQDKENIFYYLTLGNENLPQPEMPEGAQEGILKGLYKLRPSSLKKGIRAHIFGSGAMTAQALDAQIILEKYGVCADIWGATGYRHLRHDALQAQRWNMLHPDKTRQKSYIETLLEKETGVFVAVSDNMKMVPDQIQQWVPGGLFILGTDGFGRSDTRENLRRFFEVDTACIVVAVLYQLSQKGHLSPAIVTKAITDLGIDPEKSHAICL